MSVEQLDDSAVTAAEVRAGGSVLPASGGPPLWLILALAAAYVVALAALAFLPGATLIERLRALDGGICAQAPSHSFFPGGQQLPLCSRNTGIYTGFAATFLTLWFTGRLRASRFPGRWVIVVLAVAVLFMAEDGFNSMFLDLGLPHFYQPHNLLRLASGLGTGVAMCAFIVPVANTLIWRNEDERSVFSSLRQLAVMAPVLLLIFLMLAVWSQAAVLLYPIALFSTAGLVMALSLVNLVFVLGISSRVGRFAMWRQFFPFFTLALVFAVVELLALFALKSSLMHTLGMA
ncbi:MAG: hypothetical protein OJF49_004325 [Ktedonobacterales bacterium]|jgi:uncharacterized membrane protein|nr:MAG: hypothetical protein OJF49_004325 [Ktedonobacterales bacterium]